MAIRCLVVIGIVSSMLLVTGPAFALSSTSGDAGPNFNESRGCGDGQQGVHSPYVGDTGAFRPTEPIRVYGPRGDFFGRNYSQLSASMRDWDVPMSGGLVARVHKALLPALDRVTEGLAGAQATGEFYPVFDLSDWVFRTVWGREYLSNHAMGNAIDLNPGANPYRTDNVLITDMPQWYVEAWRDGGFCWGGDWIDLKDTMHYSWMGPWATAGYGPRPTPYPPLTAAAPFGPAAVDVATAYGATADLMAMADRSRDGADDLYRLRSSEDGIVVEAAGARSDFGTVGYRVRTGIGAADSTLADFDGDARADLVVFDRTAGSFAVWSDRSAFTEVIATGPIPAGDAQLAFGYGDGDWGLDLFAVTPGATTTITVFTAASGFTSGPAASLPIDTTGAALALGDFDVDGLDDLYAVHRGDGTLVVAMATQGAFVAGAPIATAVEVGGGQLLIGDYDGDGRDDLYVARDGRLRVHLGGVPLDPISRWFLPEDPAAWDAGPECVGPNACPQIGFVDSAGRWFIKDEPAAEADETSFFYGNPADVPFAGDWNGDGVETPGLYRQSDGYVYLRNSSDEGVADISFFFGNPGDVPIIGDFDGDGDDTVSLYRPSQQRFYIINRLGSGDGGLGAAEVAFQFGDPGDKPFSGDFDGNGIDDVGLHRESTGLIYYRLELSSGIATDSFIFGDPGDVIVAGDWDGDGRDTLGAYRPGDGNWYLKSQLSDGFADHVIHYHDDDGATSPVVGTFGTIAG